MAQPTQSFESVFASLREKVLALCLHLTGNRHDAEDALQDTFLSVPRALPEFRGEAQLSTWVFRIALRAALRVKARRPRTESPPDEASEPASEHAEKALEGLLALESMRVSPLLHGDRETW